MTKPKAKILGLHYAARRYETGNVKVFAYFEEWEGGSIREDKYAGSVVLTPEEIDALHRWIHEEGKE